MKNSLLNQHYSFRLLGLASCMAVAIACCFSSQSFALIDGDFNVMLGESPRYLEATLRHQRGEITASQLYVIKYEESCKNPSIRLQDRNRPAFLVHNTSTQDNTISSFVIDLQQAGFEFGTGDNSNSGFNGNLVLPNPYSDPGIGITANYVSGDTTKLQVNFTGLGMGEAAIFRVDLDPVPMVNVAFPDYRGIILGANVGQGATDPALVSATFSMTGMPDVTTTPVAFDGDVNGTIASGLLEVYLEQSRTDRFDLDGGTPVIPEPTTLSLLALAGLGLVVGRRSRVA